MALGAFLKGSGSSLLNNLVDPLRYKVIKAAWSLMPWSNLEVQEYFHLFKLGFITSEQMREFSRMLGFNWNPDLGRDWFNVFKRAGVGPLQIDWPKLESSSHHLPKFMQTNKPVLTLDLVLTLLNRGLLDDEAAWWALMQQFGGETKLATALKELRYEIPPISDLIQFSVKEAFNSEIIQAMGYNKEFPIDLLPYAAQLGYGRETGFNIPPGATTTAGPEMRTKANWLDHYWYAHWDNMSPTQWFQALHRFYPASLHGPSPELTEDNRTTAVDVERGLKVSDYPEPLRKRLMALSYSPLTRVDVRRMHKVGVLNEDEVFHAYRAIGYSDTNAERLKNFTVRINSGSGQFPTKNRAIKAAERMVKVGVMDIVPFNLLMGQLGLTAEEATARYMVNISEVEADNAEQGVKQIKKWFLNGTLNQQFARLALQAIPIQDIVIDRLLTTWGTIKNFGTKFFNADKGVELFKKGLMNENNLTAKLFNLGYVGSEVGLIINAAKLDMLSAAQKVLKQQEKENAKLLLQQQREQLKTAKEGKTKTDREQANAIKAKEKQIGKALVPFSEKNIATWFKAGAMNEESVRLVLAMKGWEKTAIDNFVEINLGVKE